MSVRVFIDGAAGTTGLEIRDRLSGRTDIELLLLLDDKLRKNSVKRREALNSADFVILCLPDDAAREAVELIENPDVRVIDASSAHRTGDGWTYGLPELEPAQPKLIAEASRVSNPGCWPTGFLLLVRPLVRSGLVPHDWPLVYSGASGYSGGGKSMIAEFEDESAKGHETTAYRSYGLGMAHKHLPEMHRHARLATPPMFLPAVARAYRGMLSEVALPLHALPRRPSLATIETTLRDAYKDSPVVSVQSAEHVSMVRIEENAGTDRLWIRVFGNAESGQARLIATYDNLGKGAGGAAVQNLNLMAGLDPAAGLVV